jgi:DNA-binding FrmR family transcriptional regulator
MAKKQNDCCTQYPDYGAEMPRLNRVTGQVEGIKKMIEERRYCPDILAQLRAVRAALHSIEANILESHLDSCVTDALNSDNAEQKTEKIAELKSLYKRFSN